MRLILANHMGGEMPARRPRSQHWAVLTAHAFEARLRDREPGCQSQSGVGAQLAGA